MTCWMASEVTNTTAQKWNCLSKPLEAHVFKRCLKTWNKPRPSGASAAPVHPEPGWAALSPGLPVLPGAPGSPSPETGNPSLRGCLVQLHLGPGRGALTALPSPPGLLHRRASSRHPAQPRAAPPPTSIPTHTSHLLQASVTDTHSHGGQTITSTLMSVCSYLVAVMEQCRPARPAEAAALLWGEPGPAACPGPGHSWGPLLCRDGTRRGKGPTAFETAAISDLLLLCLTPPQRRKSCPTGAAGPDTGCMWARMAKAGEICSGRAGSRVKDKAASLRTRIHTARARKVCLK